MLRLSRVHSARAERRRREKERRRSRRAEERADREQEESNRISKRDRKWEIGFNSCSWACIILRFSCRRLELEHLGEGLSSGVRVAIDLGFERLMSEKELGSLAAQVGVLTTHSLTKNT